MFVEVPTIGTGTRRDPFRPKLPAGTEYSAYIPTGKDVTLWLIQLPSNSSGKIIHRAIVMRMGKS